MQGFRWFRSPRYFLVFLFYICQWEMAYSRTGFLSQFQSWFGFGGQLLPSILNTPPQFEDWFAYVNGLLDYLEAHQRDDFRIGHHQRRAKARGKTAIFRMRQAQMCAVQGIECARLIPGFYYTGETDYYTSGETEEGEVRGEMGNRKPQHNDL